MQQYLDLMRHVRTNGVRKTDRTGTGTLSVFGHQMRFDLADGFPLVTTKKLHMKSIIHELLWFLAGDTNTRYLQGSTASRSGTSGPTRTAISGRSTASSGAPGRRRRPNDRPDQRGGGSHRNGIPTRRRIIVSAWNPADIPQMALAPCHCLFQFYVADGRLSCQLYQRSADIFLGVPFNIASYALLTMMMAQVTGLKPGDFVHTFGDAHLYLNHLEQADLQLQREPRPLPRMVINPDVGSIFDFTLRGFRIAGLRSSSAHQGAGGGLIHDTDCCFGLCTTARSRRSSSRGTCSVRRHASSREATGEGNDDAIFASVTAAVVAAIWAGLASGFRQDCRPRTCTSIGCQGCS